ncbi:MAG: helix-turn-helix transcriptional regulator [Candidatus Omnitrophica bacterium]|nr:helix-turn-helix transcriptional regulator [Candidatus Omnitrophota bacterium]
MDTDIRLKLAKRIKELRKKKGLTQEQLSEQSGIDYKHIQLLESNKASAAKLDTIEKLAKAFNMSPSKLLKF